MGNQQITEHILAPVREKKRWLIINIMACVMGVLGGFGSVLLRLLIDGFKFLFFTLLLPILTLQIGPINLGYIILAAIGAVFVGLITNKFSNDSKGSGIPEIIEDVALKRGKMPTNLGPIKAVVTSITINVASAGREGPVALFGGWIGSMVGRFDSNKFKSEKLRSLKFKFRPHEIRLLIASGVAAGVAGTFNSPLGGAIFSLEILFNGFGIFSSIPVFLASVLGAVIHGAIFGTDQPFGHVFSQTILNPGEFILIALVGVAFGVIGFLWLRLFYYVRKFFMNIKISKYLKPVLGASLAGILIMIFPTYGIIGTGYEGINLGLDAMLVPWLMVILGIAKMLATAFTLGSDNSGGVFGPSLYIGCMFGGAFGYFFEFLFPDLVPDPALFMVIGMAAMFSATAQCPINMSIMIPEMVKSFWVIPPVMVGCGTSFLTSWFLTKRTSIYTLKLEMRGTKLKVGSLFLLQNLSLDEIMTEIPIKISPEIKLDDFQVIDNEYHNEEYPVIVDGELKGIIFKRDVDAVPKEKLALTSVNEVMKPDFPIIDHYARIQDALDLMVEYNRDFLVVVMKNDTHNVIGVISKSDIMRSLENQ